MEIKEKDILKSALKTINPEQAIQDYRLIYQSRQVSLMGRREVLTGKAKFGIFGDGKELPQIAMAKVFQPGDVRSGYYRDQTFAFAVGLSTMKHFFAQLYANPDLNEDPFSAGRQMNSHFASRNLDENGHWKDLTKMYTSSADGSPTASQMPRLVGLAQASKLYRSLPGLEEFTNFSRNGNEVAFGTIGNASCAEGHFWEAINAIGVIQAPVVISIWDDDYGISVPNEFQLTKRSLSEQLSGFQRSENDRGFEIFSVKAWDYEGLLSTYEHAVKLAREEHIPVIIHVYEVTQPQGHSTSGSHERYKTAERLEWEKSHDCLLKMREYILSNAFISEEELETFEKEDRKTVRNIKNEAWKAFQAPIHQEAREFMNLVEEILPHSQQKTQIMQLLEGFKKNLELTRGDISKAAHKVLLAVRGESSPAIDKLKAWKNEKKTAHHQMYGSHLYSESDLSPMYIKGVEPVYSDASPTMSGFEVLNKCFDEIFEKNPLTLAFGEDVGQLGDVNQGFAGLQKKYGRARVMDTGIREATIIGQAVGLAMRGFRPIAEIQYLDYFIYGLQTLSDDLATLHYRTKGGQKAPAIIRTRGHRLEGIWHAGSPLGMMVHALRGIHIAVPRNMTKAAAFYHTFLKGDDPAVVIEVLNAYRLKERLPDNYTEMCEPLGVPEILQSGSDVTLLTYGACCKIAMDAAKQLAEVGVSLEIIDVQTLLPFDIHHSILESIKKTSRIVFFDEDVPGGATAYMMQEVLEKQGGYYHLDSEPRTLTAQVHRPAFGDDGDYFSKPQVEDVFKTVYELMNESDPSRYPMFY